jgi:hypothetical protein
MASAKCTVQPSSFRYMAESKQGPIRAILSNTGTQLRRSVRYHVSLELIGSVCKFPRTPTTTGVTTGAAMASSAAANCTVQQVNAFTSALATASSGCMATTSYNWGGSTSPTDTQYTEICKCTDVKPFAIPTCTVEKGPVKGSLQLHYDWVRLTQCRARCVYYAAFSVPDADSLTLLCASVW